MAFEGWPKKRATCVSCFMFHVSCCPGCCFLFFLRKYSGPASSLASMAHTVKNLSVPMCALITYGMFCGIYFPIHCFLAGTEVSGMMTVGVLFQCLGFAMLVVQTMTNDSAQGISPCAVQLKFLALLCRLSCSTWLNGYLPLDATGDGFFQFWNYFTANLQ